MVSPGPPPTILPRRAVSRDWRPAWRGRGRRQPSWLRPRSLPRPIDVAWARAARIRLQGRWSEALLASPAAGDHDETAAQIDPHLFEALALAGTLDHAALAVPGPAVRGARKTLARIGRLLASSRKTMREHERSERGAKRKGSRASAATSPASTATSVAPCRAAGRP